ncbi:30S ribosomal protein S6 [bacterium]|nr:30S ribosomal protein S6 [bacterium]
MSTRHDYEGVFIIDPSSGEEGEKSIAAVEEVIGKNKGTVEKKEKWGRKNLAYEIKRKKEGFHFLLSFKIEPKAISELKKAFRMNNSILRHLIFRK